MEAERKPEGGGRLVGLSALALLALLMVGGIALGVELSSPSRSQQGDDSLSEAAGTEPDSATPGQDAAGEQPAPAGTVRVGVGDDLQQAVDDNPPGTTYLLAAGIHREQQVVPNDGDRFAGEPGAILSGARDLSIGVVDWVAEQGAWYVDGQQQEGMQRGKIAEGGNQLDRHPEELFSDNRRLKHVASIEELLPGTWHFDYAGDRIWIGEDPRALGLLETSVTPDSISGERTPVRDVVVENLVIEKYASPAQLGAIGGHLAYGWSLNSVTVRDNHGGGVRIGPGMTVSASQIARNGQIGLVGSGADEDTGETAPVVVRENEISNNLALDFDPAWEGGGTKFTRMYSGLLVENNWIRDNTGHGLWVDIENYDVTLRSNLIEKNGWKGIFYEISYGPHPELGGAPTRIYWNELQGNGFEAPTTARGSAIMVSNSEQVEVFENVLHGNAGGILLRESSERIPHVVDVVVRNNDISFESGLHGIIFDGSYDDTARTHYAADAGIIFAGNEYQVSAGAGFAWAGDTGDQDFWREAAGENDLLAGTASQAGFTRGAVEFSRSDYGARDQ